MRSPQEPCAEFVVPEMRCSPWVARRGMRASVQYAWQRSVRLQEYRMHGVLSGGGMWDSVRGRTDADGI